MERYPERIERGNRNFEREFWKLIRSKKKRDVDGRIPFLTTYELNLSTPDRFIFEE